jgi:CRISPR-associated DxTHG motif protein
VKPVKLLTFIGVNQYKETSYQWDGRSHWSKFVAEALAEWIEPECIVVLLTAQASQHPHWQEFQRVLKQRTLVPVTIPDGNTEQELWEIFDGIVAHVDSDEQIALDITHAFRFLPMLLLTVGAFLRVTKRVQIQHVFYGRYIEGQNETPVLDLVLLLHLLEWTSATQRFKEIGDARWIGETLCQTHRRLWQSHEAEPSSLFKAGSTLNALSQALQLARPREAAQTAHDLVRVIPQASGEISAWARPFSLLLEEVQHQASELAYEPAEILNEAHLRKQLSFVQSLVRYGLVAQSALVAREWVVNWSIWYKNDRATLQKEQWLPRQVREKIEAELNSAFPPEKGRPHRLVWLDNPKLDDCLKQLWPGLCDLRNDLAHCGMREGVRKAQDLREQTTKYAHMLTEVMRLSQWG